MKKEIDEIVDQISQRPTDMLAMGRTIMASERTFLGYVRTSIGFLAGGIGIVMYLEHLFLNVLGVVLILISIVVFVVGVRNYRRMQTLLEKAYETLKLSNDNAGENFPDERDSA